MNSPVKAKKALGQHFLTSEDVARRTAEAISSDQLPAGEKAWGEMPVLEIGPGTGMLSKYLLASGRQLKAVELDSESVAYLKRAMPDLDVIEADFLKVDFSQLMPEGPFALIGNYPYNISSQIFFRVLDERDRIPVCAGMLQREVAQRICAGPGSKVYGILSVLLQTWYECQYLFTVGAELFNPPPKVQSAVIRLVRNGRTELPVSEKLYKTVIKTAFGQRRKTLRNSLSSLIASAAASKPDPQACAETLKGLEVMSLRPEQLSVSDFITLTAALQR